MKREIELGKFWCWNEECPDYGKIGNKNITPKEYKGKYKIALLQCKTCKRCFSENRGTIFFGLNTPKDEILRTLAMIPEKGSIRGTGRATGHDKDTIIRWLNLAGKHCKEINEYFLHDLQLTRVQIDEIWAFIKKRRKT